MNILPNAAEKRPDLIPQWHPTKNGTLQLKDLKVSDSHIVWWQCEKGEDHVWSTELKHRALRVRGCPFCRGKMVCFSNSIANTKLIAEFDESKTEKPANEIYKGYKKHVWWKCLEANHSWAVSPSVRMRGNRCPECSGRRTDPLKSIAVTDPDIAFLLNEKLSKITGLELLPGSGRKVWWNCITGDSDHIHDMPVRDKTGSSRAMKKLGCPHCSNRRVNSKNNLSVVNPAMALEFDAGKNKITADSIVAGSATMYQWKCAKNHSWQATPATRTYAKTECPKCDAWRHTSKSEIMFRAAAQESKLFSSVEDFGRSLPIYWPRFGLEVDILGVTQSGSRKVAIEYDGVRWHNAEVNKERDLRKTIALLAAGYLVVRIRENDLPFLDLVDTNLFQVSHQATLQYEPIVRSFTKIENWLSHSF